MRLVESKAAKLGGYSRRACPWGSRDAMWTGMRRRSKAPRVGPGLAPVAPVPHTMFWVSTRSTIKGGRGCNKIVPVLRGNGTKIAPTGDIFDQPPGGMSWIRGKLADHVGDHVVLSTEEGVLVTSPGTESSYPRPPQSLNNSFTGWECSCFLRHPPTKMIARFSVPFTWR